MKKLTRNSTCPRSNSKSFQVLVEMINKTRDMMIKEFGEDRNIIIDNTINYSYIITDDKSSPIHINTSGLQIHRIIENVVHEFCHIRHPNCHQFKKRKKTKEEIKESMNHEMMTRKLKKIALKELGI